MVAVIKVGSSINRTFYYNENKVKEGVAELLLTENYPIDMEDMNEGHRLNMLLRTAESNPNVRANSVHISLNFAVGEQLEDDKLRIIAGEYMQAIGFGNQPYLVYRHDDAGHQHIHIVSVKVGLDGKRIETQNIARELSEPARKDIETRYGLVNAEEQDKGQEQLLPVDASKVQYGKTGTKRAIQKVLDHVVDEYKFTSIGELNAVLGMYNVNADTGKEGSRLQQYRGLIYRVVDNDGNPLGVPIKASLFHNRPTLDYIENKFLNNDVARQVHKAKIKSIIDFAISSKRPKTPAALEDNLKRNGIKMVLRQNEQGLVYGITYVDFKTKCVFNGSALGKAYSAKGLTERLGLHQASADKTRVLNKENHRNSGDNTAEISQKTLSQQEDRITESNDEKTLLDLLLQHEFASNAVPFEWKKKKMRKKKR